MEQREEARRKLFYDLTVSPDYQQYREQLMYAIIRIVREKYLKTTVFNTKAEREAFLSNLSIYLHEVLHETITEYFYVPTDNVDVRAQNESNLDATEGQGTQNNGSQSQVDTLSCHKNENANVGGITPEQILTFAQEAQSLGKTDVAERWFQELCARQPNNADNWFNYATFCLSDGDIDKAQQCLCEAITIDSNHHPSLICAPFVLCMTKHSLGEEDNQTNRENNWPVHEANDFIKEGQIFLERAQHNTDQNPGLTWTLSALFHEFCMESNSYPTASILMDQALMKAKEIECTQKTDEFIVPDSYSLQAARFLIKCNLLTFAEKALTHELSHRGTAIAMQNSLNFSDIGFEDRVFIEAHTSSNRIGEYNCLLGQLHMVRGTNEKLELAQNLFHQATEIHHRFTEAWAMLGHVNYMTGNVDEAIRCYNRVLDDARAISDNSSKYSYMHLVYLRLGRIYLDRKEYEKAKSVFVDSCNKETPTVQSWLGIGKACYYQNQFDDAEDALAEANMLDQRQPDVWALLSAVCLQQSILKPSVCRKDEAEQSFKYAIKMGCNDEVLLNELNGLQIHAGLGDPSF